jgi:hypothetical protein
MDLGLFLRSGRARHGRHDDILMPTGEMPGNRNPASPVTEF